MHGALVFDSSFFISGEYKGLALAVPFHHYAVIMSRPVSDSFRWFFTFSVYAGSTYGAPEFMTQSTLMVEHPVI